MKPESDPFAALDDLIRDSEPDQLPAVQSALAARMASAAMRMMEATNGRKDTGAHEQTLSVSEAAQRLGMSKAWMYKNHGKLPFTVHVGRRLAFLARGADRWLLQQRQNTK